MIALYVIIGIVVILAIWILSVYNGLIKMRNVTEEGFATMDVYLKKRYDLIPNLVETVKGYAKHEKEVLENVTNARAMTAQAKTPDERLDAENALTGTLKTLFAVAENYPDLKANVNFLDLQQQLGGIENEIASSRKYYNAVVKEYNIKREIFPNSIIAKMGNFPKKPMFEAAEEDRQNVKVQF